MISIILKGDPEKVSEDINDLIATGAQINNIKKTKNSATYLINYTSIAPPVFDYLLLEDSSFLLLETGFKIILE